MCAFEPCASAGINQVTSQLFFLFSKMGTMSSKENVQSLLKTSGDILSFIFFFSHYQGSEFKLHSSHILSFIYPPLFMTCKKNANMNLVFERLEQFLYGCRLCLTLRSLS